MISDIKEYLKNFFSSRLFVLAVVMLVLFCMLLSRAFSLQIINGASYQENFTMNIERTLSVDATRGNIYDCNGKLLAGNLLAYSVTLTDSGSYKSTKEKNEKLNAVIAMIVTELRNNSEQINRNFSIDYVDGEFVYNVSGSALKRFLVDVFGRSSYEDLKYNTTFRFEESNATAEQVMQYLMSDSRYQVDESYDLQTSYDIVCIRYALNAYSFTRYQAITVAENVSDKTVAFMNEHSGELVGVAIQEDTIRQYYGGECIAPIIGYTGKISDEEYKELSEEDESYSSNDTIGKAGLEQFYESYLRGVKGEQTVYVNNVGKISKIIDYTDSVAGNDLYITIDSDLQKAAYDILEQEIAGIVYSNIRQGNIEMDEVYFALINNNMIDTSHFSMEDAGTQERSVYGVYQQQQQAVLDQVVTELRSAEPTINSEMSEELLDYVTYIFSMLRSTGALNSSAIDTSDETYMKWRDGKLSPQEYLNYCISMQWIDISKLTVNEDYSDSSEIFQSLVDFIISEAQEDLDFSKVIYKYLIVNGKVTGQQLCLILFEQGVLDYDDDIFNQLSDGTTSAKTFLLRKINELEITPAQLALEPCTGSCVITDTETGQVKALVSYPGYDNNRMANGVDAVYYEKLRNDQSNPLFNYATQEKTAPGSTFKMVTATASLAENIVTLSDAITCNGVFKEVSNEPKCWIYPGNHGALNVSQAIQRSCNVFFYTMGYRLASKTTGTYNDANGIALIDEYAEMYGLNKKTGLEIVESTPELADEFPVMAAIGQSNHNLTTVSLSRYVMAVTTGTLYDYQLLDHVANVEGETILSGEAESSDISEVLTSEQWDAIHSGMREVCKDLKFFDSLSVVVAGKTGTAQHGESHPNHALFVGYAPYEDPKVSIAVRIASGYTSHNAAMAARYILSYYFGDETLEDIRGKKAEGVVESTSSSITD